MYNFKLLNLSFNHFDISLLGDLKYETNLEILELDLAYLLIELTTFIINLEI